MSYFSRHMDPEDMAPRCQVIIRKAKKTKYDKNIDMPLITFFEDFDTEKILEAAEQWLDKNQPNWREEQEKFTLKVIPPANTEYQ
jgi:hypothetical protein